MNNNQISTNNHNENDYDYLEPLDVYCHGHQSNFSIFPSNSFNYNIKYNLKKNIGNKPNYNQQQLFKNPKNHSDSMVRHAISCVDDLKFKNFLKKLHEKKYFEGCPDILQIEHRIEKAKSKFYEKEKTISYREKNQEKTLEQPNDDKKSHNQNNSNQNLISENNNRNTSSFSLQNLFKPNKSANNNSIDDGSMSNNNNFMNSHQETQKKVIRQMWILKKGDRTVGWKLLGLMGFVVSILCHGIIRFFNFINK
eukprot:gb/GECH01009070.1/.p1 GENE.gb/GECH01009070.1/~~gb/GECH01009070.1/.p1  ORF type:complete len:252 (+),score=44.16 gb/GECH01009070.1/:1-756(+)